MTRVPDAVFLPASMDDAARQELTSILEQHALRINHAAYEITNVASAQTVGHDLVLASAGGSTLAVTLLPAANMEDKVVSVKKKDSGGGMVFIIPSAGETIDGGATYTISTQYTTARFLSDGANWWVV